MSIGRKIFISNTVAKPYGLTVTNSNSSVQINWMSVPASNFKIYRDNTLLSNTSLLTYTDTTGVANTTYNYQVSAVVNSIEGSKSLIIKGTKGTPSNTVVIDPLAFTTDHLPTDLTGPPYINITGQTFSLEFRGTGGVGAKTFTLLTPPNQLPKNVMWNSTTNTLSGLLDWTDYNQNDPSYTNYSIQVQLSDSAIPTNTTTTTFVAQVQPQTSTLSVPSMPTATVDVALDEAIPFITANFGKYPYILTATNLPNGVSLVAANTTSTNNQWKLSGIPTVSGIFQIEFKLSDAWYGSTVTRNIQLVVSPSQVVAPVINTQPGNIEFSEPVVFGSGSSYQDVDLNSQITYSGHWTSSLLDNTGNVVAADDFPIGITYAQVSNNVHRFTYDGISDTIGSDAIKSGFKFAINYIEDTQPSSNTAVEDSWVRRSLATGVLNSRRFDSQDEIFPPVTVNGSTAARNEGVGGSSGDMSLVTWDRNQQLSGSGCLRLQTLQSGGQTPQVGYWIEPIRRWGTNAQNGGDGYKYGLDEPGRDEFYVQFAFKPSDFWLRHFYKSKAVTDGQKIFYIDGPADGSIKGSLTDHEIILINSRQSYLGVYIKGTQLWSGSEYANITVPWASRGLGSYASDYFVQPMIDNGGTVSLAGEAGRVQADQKYGPSQYRAQWDMTYVDYNNVRPLSSRPTHGGFSMMPDTWHVFEFRVKAAAAGSDPSGQNNILQKWAAIYGQPPVLIHSTNQANFRWTSDGGQKFKGINFSNYFTQKDNDPVGGQAADALPGYTYYDEYISSKNPIPFPRVDGVASDYDINTSDLTKFNTVW